MMNRIARRHAAFAATLVLALSSFAFALPKHERGSKRFEIFGRVLKVDKEARTMLVSDHWSKKLYLINVPENASFKITFGLNMKLFQPQVNDVYKNDRVRMLCQYADKEHLAILDDGSRAIVLTVAQ